MSMQSVIRSIAETSADPIAESWVRRAAVSGVADGYAGKRRHPRVTWNAAVVLRVDEDGGERLVYATARDVSLCGLGVMSRVEIWAAGEQRSVSGRVMHSTQTLGGYVLGIQFDACANLVMHRAG